MKNFIPLELPRKIRDLTVEYETVYYRRMEDLIERREGFSEVKKAAIILDCHSSDEFLQIALEDMLKVVRKMNETRSAKYTILLWTSQGILPYEEKVTAAQIKAMLPLALPDRSQTVSSTLAEIENPLRECTLVFTLSDAGFTYQAPTAHVSKYVRLKEKMIWIISDRDNKETYDQCIRTGLIKMRNVVRLNLKDQRIDERSKEDGLAR